MKIIYKYVTKEYLKILFYALFTFITIYLIVDFFERFDMFIKYKAKADVIVTYFLFKIPLIVYQTIPVAALLATLLTIGILSKNNEITAMKSSGISIYKISLPLIIIALIITACTFILGEYITPYTNMKIASIKSSVKNKKPKYFLKHDKIWYTGRGIVYNINYFDSKTNKLHGISIFNFDDDFNLTKRVDALAAYYKDNEWVLKDVLIRQFFISGGKLKTKELIKSAEVKMTLPETPKTFKEVRRKAEEMSYRDLNRFVTKLKREGYDAVEYRVDLQAKVAIPFISVIMTLIGIPFALKRERSGSIAVGVGLSIVIGFFYWITLSFALSLGHAGVLPPLIAAWVSLFIFLLIGMYMFSTIRQ